MQVSIEFPLQVNVEDYHSLEIIQQSLKKVGINSNFLDLGFKQSRIMPFLANYVGMFYIGDLYSEENQNKLKEIEMSHNKQGQFVC